MRREEDVASGPTRRWTRSIGAWGRIGSTVAGKDIADTQPPIRRQVVNGVGQGPGSHGRRSPPGPCTEAAAGAVESAPPAPCIGADSGVEGALVDLATSDASPGRGAAK